MAKKYANASKICKIIDAAKKENPVDIALKLLDAGRESQEIKDAIFYAASQLTKKSVLSVEIFKQILQKWVKRTRKKGNLLLKL